jgi:N-acetylmuramoyl-L-alanine amidase
MTPAYMDPKAITDITIHCAATPEGKPFTASQISAMDLARKDLGNQIAYHYVVELDGKTTQTLRHDQRGAHTGGHNTGNLGICYVGGVRADGKTPADTRTPEQKAALAVLVKRLKAEFPHVTVRGHRDWPGVAKACPSFDVAKWLREAKL